MTFATPILAAIAAAIAIPTLIILYFLKLRRRDVEVSSTLLWKKAVQDLQANAPFQKLRNNILLMLQLLALIIALVAIAQPEFRHRGQSEARRIILIDRSASMSATDGDAPIAGSESASPSTPADGAATTSAPPTADPEKQGKSRLAAAKEAAIKLVESLHEPSLFDDTAEEAMVIAFDLNASVVRSFTANKADLKSAIESIQPSDAPTRLQRAFDLARAYSGAKKFEDQVKDTDESGKPAGFIPVPPAAAIHIFSDGRIPDADKIQTVEGQDRVVYHSVGAAIAPNVGVTGLRAERAFDNPGRVNIFVGLQSTDTAERSVDLELLIDGDVVAARSTRVRAATQPTGVDAVSSTNGEAVKAKLRPGLGGLVFGLDRAEGGAATVRITTSGADALSNDNVAFVTIPPAKRLAVVLVTNGNFFVKTALEGLNLSKLDVRTPDEFQKLLDDGQTAQYDVFVFDRVLPNVKINAVASDTPATAAPGAPAAPATSTAPGTPGVPPKTPAVPIATRGPGLPPGRSLVLGAVPSPPLGVTDLGEGQGTVVVDFARDHPAMRLSSIDKINISKSRKIAIAPNTPVKPLARDSFGPAVLEIADATTMAIVIPWDVADSDWPFEPGWVLFLAGSVYYLSEAQSGVASEGVRVGETLSTRLPPGAKDVRISTPGGETVALEAAPDGSVSFGPIFDRGLYSVRWNGQATPIDVTSGDIATRRIAANLLDPQESDVGAVGTLVMAREDVQSQRQDADLTRKLWPWLLLGALSVVMLEWYVYNRKVAL